MACNTKSESCEGLTENHEKILSALAGMAEPSAAKEIAAVSGLESKSMSSQLKSLKNKGYIDSPVRCKYAITVAGKAAMTS
jgi:DNA-binding MarR family transcriptional regulator